MAHYLIKFNKTHKVTKSILTCCAKSRIFVVTIWTIRRPVAQVLDGDADSITRTSEWFIRVTRVACNEWI